MLKGKTIYLRSVEEDDATTLFMWENNPENWKVSNTEVPFSMTAIHELIEQQSNIRNSGQARFIICENVSDYSVCTMSILNTDLHLLEY